MSSLDRSSQACIGQDGLSLVKTGQFNLDQVKLSQVKLGLVKSDR